MSPPAHAVSDLLLVEGGIPGAIKSRVHFRRGIDDSGFAKTILLCEPEQPFLGTVRLEALHYRIVDIQVLSVRRPVPLPAKEPTMLIVDAQIHLWNAGNPTSPWHRQIPAFLKADALKEMDAGGVDAAILTPHTPWDPNANELCMEAARAHPDRFAILGNFPVDKPESRALIDTWKQRPGMLGCRFTFIGAEQSKWPTDGTVDWLWPAAERAGLPIAMMAANFLPKVAEVAQRHPNL